MDLEDFNQAKAHAQYDQVLVEDERNNYKLRLSAYKGKRGKINSTAFWLSVSRNVELHLLILVKERILGQGSLIIFESCKTIFIVLKIAKYQFGK